MFTKLLKIALFVIIVTLLTIVTQVGGILFLGSILFFRETIRFKYLYQLVLFILLYLVSTFFVIPNGAMFFGRERITNSKNITPTNFMTELLNRNYVKPELNIILQELSHKLPEGVELKFLDANFPFFDGFPLLPHLSHNDGKKLDLSFIYEDKNGIVSNLKKSNSGYGIFEYKGGNNQNDICKQNGYYQYDFPKYLTFGRINPDLVFSEKYNKILIESLLESNKIEKIFIEPHLKARLHLTDSRVRFQGCRSVRHDDHIHVQIK